MQLVGGNLPQTSSLGKCNSSSSTCASELVVGTSTLKAGTVTRLPNEGAKTAAYKATIRGKEGGCVQLTRHAAKRAACPAADRLWQRVQ